MTTHFTRRTFGKLAAAALPLATATQSSAAINSVFGGVRLGIGSYSYRHVKLDEMLTQVASLPLGELELENWFVEPGVSSGGRGGMNPEQREALRQWRLTAPLSELQAVKKKVEDAGIHLYSYWITIDDTFTEAEIDRVFQMAQTLGVGVVNVVTPLNVAERLIAPSAKYKLRVGFHPTQGAPNPNSIGTGDSWRKVTALAPNFGVNPDLGQCANWGPDPLAFLREMKDRMTTLHTHDRRTTPPPAAYVPFGQGQMPIKEILLMMKAEKFTFVPMIERGYGFTPEMDNVKEIRNLVEYCKGILAG